MEFGVKIYPNNFWVTIGAENLNINSHIINIFLKMSTNLFECFSRNKNIILVLNNIQLQMQ